MKALNYLQKKAESDQQAALLAFDLLLEKAVGIGDHSTSDFLSNLNESLNNLVDANDRLETIEWLRGVYGDD
ncbi:MAG: hypothetical protein FI729_00875 [SAR202 cluster bacterium]|nr:hypothetical protein [SAR202 cluster bacterium]|tara:strand:- start:317 stop:532 length:216 start_codon:yes stop_codon:yes gene_type:complete